MGVRVIKFCGLKREKIVDLTINVNDEEITFKCNILNFYLKLCYYEKIKKTHNYVKFTYKDIETGIIIKIDETTKNFSVINKENEFLINVTYEQVSKFISFGETLISSLKNEIIKKFTSYEILELELYNKEDYKFLIEVLACEYLDGREILIKNSSIKLVNDKDGYMFILLKLFNGETVVLKPFDYNPAPFALMEFCIYFLGNNNGEKTISLEDETGIKKLIYKDNQIFYKEENKDSIKITNDKFNFAKQVYKDLSTDIDYWLENFVSIIVLGFGYALEEKKRYYTLLEKLKTLLLDGEAKQKDEFDFEKLLDD